MDEESEQEKDGNHDQKTSSEHHKDIIFVDGYDPFIADVPCETDGDPFPLAPYPCSPREVAQIRESLRSKIMLMSFDPPLRLDYFCLIVKERWRRQSRGEALTEKKCTSKCCILM